MQPLSPDQVRSSFVNVSRTRAKAVTVPGLDAVAWDDLDYLGWVDPKAPTQAYLVTERDGRPLGLGLRATGSTVPRRGSGLCDICLSAHAANDVGLFVAPRAGAAGREGNTVGTYVCADLACSLYARGLRALELPQVGMPVETRVAELRRRLDAFVARVLA